uniref:Nucleolar protein 4 n=1 Tax=Pipistrellus kuhlii TaxID=59472 RepID=A0A7J7YA45_PIPKU|nr:nucleolar protein 4 [Pipistrellus kuhlii]
MESERDMYRQFQDWCLRTYGDSGKTKTVTRKKYERIVQLLHGAESSSTDNAKFKFWVKSKGFQLGQPPEEVRAGGGGAKPVLYVPVKTTDGVGVDEKLSLRRVAVVEDFFDIIYSMHVETGPNGEQIRKHAGQKRTYKAISESYAFLPREAVTRFLMSCSECQKRMHLNPDGADHKDNGKPPTLVTSMIDYNMPITMAYMKHMKLQLLSSQQDEDESSIESDEFDMSDSTRMSAVNSDLSSNLEERVQSPQALQGQQDDDSAAESFNGNETVGQSSIASGGTHSREMGDSSGDGKPGLEQDQQPLNLSDSPLSAQLTTEYRTEDHSSDGKSKYKSLLISDLKMEREARENGSKSPAHSYSSYDSSKPEGGERGAEDLSLHRGDEDEDEHEDHDDAEKVAETDGSVEAERLKAFNDKSAPADKQSKPEVAQATLAASAVSGSQEVLYINGNGTYSYHSYRGLGGGLLSLSDASSSGPTDLSMKRQLAPSSGSASSASSRPQLSPTEINAVRQLVAGYRESAAFLLRSADELENLILQQN